MDAITADAAEVTAMTLDALTQKVADLDKDCAERNDGLEKDCVDRHRRTAEKLADLKIEIDRIGNEQRLTARDLDRLSNRPVDATKLVLSTKNVISLVIGSVVLVASIWNLSVKIDAQRVAQDAQATIFRAALDDMKRQLTMQQYEIQNLKDLVTAITTKKAGQ